VVDEAGKLVGFIQGDDLRALDNEPVLDTLLLAGDVAHGAALALTSGDSLSQAMRRLTDQHADGLPVVDGHGVPVGVISHALLLDYYRTESERLRTETIDDGYESSGTSRRTRVITEGIEA